MPLNIAAITSGLPGAGGGDYPATREECAKAWADAIGAYAAAMVPPSTTVAAAQAALQAQLLSAFGAPSGVGALMDTALATFATTVAAGMAPAYAGVPPVAPCGLETVFAANIAAGRSRAECIQAVATQIDLWMRTGTAALVAPPFTPTVWT